MSRRPKTVPPTGAAAPGPPTPRADAPANGPARTGARGSRRWLVGAAGVAVFGFGGFSGWNWFAAPRRLAAALPAPPVQLPAAAPDAPPDGDLAHRLAAAAARVARRGESADALEELGRLYHANGFPAEAAACWTLLARERPRDARAWRFLADARRALSDYDAMEAALARATELDPTDAAAWLQLAGLKFKTGRIAAAEHDYRRRLALASGDAYAQLGLARCALQDGRTAEARALVERLVASAPEFPPGFNLLAELQAAAGETDAAALNRWKGREAGRFREAEDPLLDGLAAWCLDPERLRTLGTVQFQTKRGDRGVAWYERAAALAPGDPHGAAALGELWLELNEPARALERLRRAVELSPANGGDPSLFANLARALRELGRGAEALAAVRDGLRRCGEHPVLLPIHGLTLAEAGRFAEAEQAFRAGIARLPPDANVRYNFAALLLDLGRRDEGKAELRAALGVQPTFPKALRLLGQLEFEDGRMEPAREAWQRLLDSNPGVPEVRRLMAEWHGRAGAQAQERNDLAAAEAHFRAGCALVPEAAPLNASLGVLLLVAGRVDEAVAPLERYAQGRPREAQAALFLGQAYARLGRVEDAKRQLQRGAQLAGEAGQAQTAEFCREILRQLGP